MFFVYEFRGLKRGKAKKLMQRLTIRSSYATAAKLGIYLVAGQEKPHNYNVHLAPGLTIKHLKRIE